MPQAIDELFEFLRREVVWLHGRWIVFEQLYNKSADRVELLNEAASTFFYLLQHMMLDDLQLSLSKLTDPAKKNGSLQQLQRRLKKHGDPKLSADADKVLQKLIEAATPFRTWRDKQIAHYDLGVALQQHVQPMPDIYYRALAEALRLVREYMNLIEGYYHDSTRAYENFIMHSDGEMLVNMLKFGLRYQELLHEKKLGFGDLRESRWFDA